MGRGGIRYLALPVLILSLFVQGCQGKSDYSGESGNRVVSPGTTSNEETAYDNDYIKIGWIGTISGRTGNGRSELNAIKLFFDEINSKGGILGGKMVGIIAYDSQNEPEEAVRGVEELINKEKVIAILGPNSSKSAIPIADALTRARIPGITTMATNPRVTIREDSSLNPYMFRVCFIDTYQGEVAGSYAREVLEVNKAAVLYDKGDAYSKGLATYFEDYFLKAGGDIVAKEEFVSGDTDFSRQLESIKSRNPEILFLPIFYYDLFEIAKQARAIGINAVFLGGDAWACNITEDAKAALEGSYSIDHVDPDDPKVQDFKRKYLDMFGESPETRSYLAYDAARMLVDAIERAGGVNPQKITEALETTDMEGITGRIAIRSTTHDPEGKEAAILKIIEGKFKFQQKYTARK